MKPDIKGLLTGNDEQILYDAAVECRGNAIEIGSFRGASTVILAQGLKDGNGGMLFTIDPYDKRLIDTGLLGTGVSIRLFNRYNRMIRNRNIRKYGCKNVLTYDFCSYDTATMFADDSIGLLFIDGDHSYPAVKCDLHMYIPKLQSGGILLVHDHAYSGVVRAIREEVHWDEFDIHRFDDCNTNMAIKAYRRG